MQVVDKLREFKLSGGKIKDANKIDTDGMNRRETRSILPACFKSSAIASILGAMPGVGGGVAQFMCYNEVRRSSKHPEEFGKGCLEGIAAAESSNNAVVGSAMIPLLTLGIPGDGVTALLLGAFYALNPAVFIDSAAWGQIDSVLTLLVVVCAIEAVRGRYVVSLPESQDDLFLLKMGEARLNCCFLGHATKGRLLVDDMDYGSIESYLTMGEPQPLTHL
jgi:TctA family transporter